MWESAIWESLHLSRVHVLLTPQSRVPSTLDTHRKTPRPLLLPHTSFECSATLPAPLPLLLPRTPHSPPLHYFSFYPLFPSILHLFSSSCLLPIALPLFGSRFVGSPLCSCTRADFYQQTHIVKHLHLTPQTSHELQ